MTKTSKTSRTTTVTSICYYIAAVGRGPGLYKAFCRLALRLPRKSIVKAGPYFVPPMGTTM